MLAAMPPALASDPPLGEITVVRSVGSGGIRLNLQAESDVDLGRSSFRLLSGSVGFVAVAEPLVDGVCRFLHTADACLRLFTWRLPAAAGGQGGWWGTSDPWLRAGFVDIYVLTDGVAEFTLALEGPGGTYSYETDQSVQGHIAELDRRCDSPACGYLAHGGNAFDVRGPGLALVRGSYAAQQDAHATGLAETCIYDWKNYGWSPDPVDHPNGCDWVWESDDAGQASLTAQRNAGLATTVGHSAYATTRWRTDATGPTYLGYRIGAAGVEAPATYGAYGIWLGHGFGT